MEPLVPRTAVAVLGKYRGQLDEGAKRLLAKETLTCEELPVLDERRLVAAASSAATAPRAPRERSSA
jgi:hypothetical protein